MHHMQVWHPKDLSLGQREAIRQRLLQGLLLTARGMEPLLLPAHPQANGQVEVTNRSLLKIIKTRLEGAKSIWAEELLSILWAYRTTARTPTGETPFRLTYGNEAVIPAEVSLTSYRVHNHDEKRNDEAIRLQLDLVDEVRMAAGQRLARYQDRMAKHYNSRVKHRDFQVGETSRWETSF
ncbi:uncharacterized protein LOC136063157 [Quercus suber]|uniref:uncharacterized protein LOC136063157 n=1 Tax=Quercus suber TaxID=58331 RepID=UPI0032DF6B89